MNPVFAKLNMLRGKDLSELAIRSKQGIAKLADRVFIASAGEMDDEALYREFKAGVRNGTGEGAAGLLRDRLRAGEGMLLPPLANRKAIAQMMKQRFRLEHDEIIGIAEKAILGKFDLLGYAALDFGDPVEWHLNPLTGDMAPLVHWSQINPAAPAGRGDLKVNWELNRHSHFVTLGQAYWLTSDHRYVQAFANQALAWIDANPIGWGAAWAGGLETALRSISWLWALNLCAQSWKLSEDVFARILKSLIEHGCHMEKYLSCYSSPNTLLIAEALSLFYLGVGLPELRRAEGWRKIGLRILLEQLPKQIRGDGVHFEQASYYHRYAADFYTHLFLLIRANDLSQNREEERLLWRKLEAVFDHLMWLKRPDGSWPFLGDDDGGRLIKFAPRAANDFRDTLALGAAIYKRGDWKQVAGAAPAEMLWLLGEEGLACYDRLEACRPEELSRAFKDSGYFVMRDGWAADSSYALIDCGRHGSEVGEEHAHADALAIELSVNGTTWLVDPGTFVHAADPLTRDWFRSTPAHNTATVDGFDQSERSTPFAWNNRADCRLVEFSDHGEYLCFEGWHDGYQRLNDPVTHNRSLLMLFKRSAFIVSDRFTARARHDYAIRYHFTPDCQINAWGNRIEARMANGATLILNFFANGEDVSGMTTRVETGWVSTCYGRRAESPIAVFDVAGAGPLEITTVILTSPSSGNAGQERNERYGA